MSVESWVKESSYILTCAERLLGSFGKQRIHVNVGLQDTAGVQDRASGQGWAHQRCWSHLWGSVLKEEGGKEPQSSQREECDDVEMPGDCKVSAGGAGDAAGTGVEIALQPMEIHGDAGIPLEQPTAQPGEGWDPVGSPGRIRFAGRTWDPAGDPLWSRLLLKDFTPWEGSSSSWWRSHTGEVHGGTPLWNRTSFCEEGAEMDWAQPHSLSPCTAGQEEMQKIRKLSPTEKGGVGRKCFKIWF